MQYETMFSDPFFTQFFGNNNPNYPPYNIVEEKNGNVSLEVALAGFSKEDIIITTNGNSLVIESKEQPKDEKKYQHRGIAKRKFELSFTMGNKTEFDYAKMVNGMLYVHLKPDTTKSVRQIDIC